MSNLSVKNAFDWFKSDEPTEKILELIPDEYHLWYRDITNKILDKCNSIITNVKTDYFKLITLNDNRKIFSLNIKTHPYKTLLFKIYDCHKNFKNLKNLESDNFKTNEFLINDTSIKNTIFNFIQDYEFFKQLQKDNLPIHFK